MATYNHAFSLGFACKNSKYENPDDALVHEKDKIINALLQRVEDLIMNDSEFRQACEPFDTFEEEGKK